MENFTQQTGMVPGQATKDHTFVIDFRALFLELLDKLVIIVLLAGIAFFGTFLLDKLVLPPSYTSTTSIYVLPRPDAERSVSMTDLQIGSQLTSDYMEIIQSYSALDEVIQHFELDMTVSEFAGSVSVNNPNQTRILEISVTNEDPVKAKQYADYLRKVGIKKIIEDTEVTSINVEDPANLPTEEDISTMKLSLIVAILVAIFAAAVFVIRYLVTDKLVTADDITNRLGLTVLGSIPLEESAARSSRRRAGKQNRKGGQAQ